MLTKWSKVSEPFSDTSTRCLPCTLFCRPSSSSSITLVQVTFARRPLLRLLVSQGSRRRAAPRAISTTNHGRREASGPDRAESDDAASPSPGAEHPSLLQPSSMPPLGLDGDGQRVSHPRSLEGTGKAPAFSASHVSSRRTNLPAPGHRLLFCSLSSWQGTPEDEKQTWGEMAILTSSGRRLENQRGLENISRS